MTYSIETTSGFEKDIKLIAKRAWDISLLKEVIELLEAGNTLPPKYKNHKLKGEWIGVWDCHIQPDWVLLYRKDEKAKIIYLIATGTHSDLFR